MRSVLLLLLALPITARPVEAQRLPAQVRAAASTSPAPIVDSIPPGGDQAGAALGAAVLGAVGFFILGYGTHYLGGSGEGWAAFEAALWGEAIGVGVGAHVGNRGRGSVLAPVAASVLVYAAARVLGAHADLPSAAIIVVPMLQIIAAVSAETATARSRAGR